MPRYLTLFVLLALFAPALFAQDLPSIEEKTEGMTKLDGFFPLYWDADGGKVWLEIPRFDAPFLYSVSLPAGLGSNDVGLDRGQLGGERIVHFERVGPQVLLVQPNLGFRADTDNAAERRAVKEAFAEGVVWGFTAGAASGARVLVDATDFIVRDAHGAVRQLRQTGQGSFSLDKSRSAPYLPRTKAFPENTEMEARLTFTSDEPGRYVRDVAADPTAVTLRVRHSFVMLPPPGFVPRPNDPRSGFFGIEYVDYATPIGEAKEKRFIARHRLACARARGADGLCEPNAPIVYYLDPGTPEPVRSALLDGARWWNEAFVAAGYRNAFRVEMLPDDADPLDARYNVIQWVHRATRGWSYGSGIIDPRTGEIIKGHVSLGSLRVRQDYLLAEGLLAPYTGENEAGFDPANDPMLAMALARLRQLSAHEVGHTLGLAHNFAASVNDRASVMDYPAPLALVEENGRISLADAYATGMGDWDKMAIRYGYTDFPADANEGAALDALVQEAEGQGLFYVTDTDARPPGAAHPYANLWDNGEDMVAALEREMQVREIALQNFGAAVIRAGEPLALLEEALVPLYLRHRYQVEGTVKLVGGLTYSYAVRGAAPDLPTPVPANQQMAAVEALLGAVSPEALRLPQEVWTMIPPRPPGYGQNRELFDGYTGLPFDPYAPAQTAARMVLELLVHPERAARLAYQEDFAPALPGFATVLDAATDALWKAPVRSTPYDAELQRLVQNVWGTVLMDLAATPKLAPPVRARTHLHLTDLAAWLEANPGGEEETRAHRGLAHAQISRFLGRAYEAAEQPEALETPPGSPIGQE